MSKHTPGPWFVGKNSDDSGNPVFLICANAVENENKRIARIFPSTGIYRDGENHSTLLPVEANASLIAAAPELLRECRIALEMIQLMALDNPVFASNAGYTNMRHRLREVIAKAEGRDE